MRKVALPKDSVRGGIMTQASVLKVTANGTTTSPVLRGVWIMERILGFHTAPPLGRARSRTGYPGRGHHPPATRPAPRRSHLRCLPPQDRSSGLRARKLRCHGRLARPLSRLRRGCRSLNLASASRASLSPSTMGCRWIPPAHSRWPHLQRHSRIQTAPARSRGANGRPKPRQPACHLRHRRAHRLLGSQTGGGSPREDARLGLRSPRHRSRDRRRAISSETNEQAE